MAQADLVPVVDLAGPLPVKDLLVVPLRVLRLLVDLLPACHRSA